MYKIFSDILFRRLKLCADADPPSPMVTGAKLAEMAGKEHRSGCFVEYFAQEALFS